MPRLRRLARKVTKSCHGCYRFQAKAFAAPPPGKLPTDRTEGSGSSGSGFRRSTQVSEVQEPRRESLFDCLRMQPYTSSEVLTTMETTEFLGSLTRLIARRGRPTRIYSDNGGTFVAAAKWLRTVMRALETCWREKE